MDTVWALLDRERRAGKRILFEGAQGALLDIDHGTYPFVTSSNTVAAQAATGSGVGPGAINYVLGITKAYTTRVGEGPFPTELKDATGKLIGERGVEFGTVTGRPRRCGWFDARLVRQTRKVGGINGIALTKLDVLDDCPSSRSASATGSTAARSTICRRRKASRHGSSRSTRRSKAGRNRPAARGRGRAPGARHQICAPAGGIDRGAGGAASTSPKREDTILVHDPFVDWAWPMADKFPWKVAWITGASGAICGELAKRLAAAGVMVAATARPSERLDALAAANETIKAYPADVLDAEALKACAAEVERALGAIDLALLGAGMYVPFDIRNIDLDGFHKTMALNVDGVINAIAAVLPAMLERRAGHIAIMGSLFGYSGWPETGSYGASKAAVINLAESLRLELEGTGVDVTIINPGFVDTPLNASYDAEKKLYVMSKERCARKILEKLGDKPYEIAFPPQVAGFLKTVRAMPRALAFPLIRRFTRRLG